MLMAAGAGKGRVGGPAGRNVDGYHTRSYIVLRGHLPVDLLYIYLGQMLLWSTVNNNCLIIPQRVFFKLVAKVEPKKPS